MSKRRKQILEVVQIVSTIFIIVGGIYNQIDFWDYDYIGCEMLFGLVYNGAIIFCSLVLVYCIYKFNIKIFLIGNMVLFIGMVIRLIEIAKEIIFGGEVPVFSICIVGIPYTLVIVLTISIILKKSVLSRSVAVANAAIWGAGGIYGISFIIEYNLWKEFEIFSYIWLIGCAGLFYSFARILFIYKEDIQNNGY